MGNTVSNLFYPANPKRKRRAEELNSDLFHIKREFDALYEQYKRTILEVEPEMNKILKALGYRSVAELSDAVRKNVTGDALKKWENVQNLIDRSDRVHGIIDGISSIVALGGLAVAGTLVLFGVVAVATAGTALTALAGVLVVVAVAAIIAGAIEGAIIRDKLRDSIRDQFYKRRDGMLALEQMKVIKYWAGLIKTMFFDANAMFAATEGLLSPQEKLNTLGSLTRILERPKKLYDEVNMAKVDAMLLRRDIGRGSWRSEDPKPSSARSLKLVSSSETEGILGISLRSFGKEYSALDTKLEALTVALQLKEMKTDRAAIVYLKQDDEYIALYDDEGTLYSKSCNQEDAKYLLESLDECLHKSSINLKLTSLSNDGENKEFYIVGTLPESESGYELLEETDFVVATKYIWIENICYLPATICFDVTPSTLESEFLPCFSLTRAEWGNPDCDALCWFLGSDRDDLTFRTKLFSYFPKVTRHATPFRLEFDESAHVTCTVTPTSATYSVNGKKYATATYEDGEVPHKGYFGFASYTGKGVEVSNAKIYHG